MYWVYVNGKAVRWFNTRADAERKATKLYNQWLQLNRIGAYITVNYMGMNVLELVPYNEH